MSFPCMICKTPALEAKPPAGDVLFISCPRCGRFEITGSAASVLQSANWPSTQVANASGWLRERPDTRLSSRDVEFLAGLRSPTVEERAMKVLRELGRSTTIGKPFTIKFGGGTEQCEWLAISWSASPSEVSWLFVRHLLAAGYIDGSAPKDASMLINGSVTPEGHRLLSRLDGQGGNGTIGFCAMWFDPTVLNAWSDAICPSIDGAGYMPQRIDKHEHNNKIDDEIVAMIRKSRFVVADFTGHRGGVYFEAGFAMGLGIPVIWTVRHDHLFNAHFDTRQYAHIVWKADELTDFRNKLQSRIEATIGVGPFRRRP